MIAVVGEKRSDGKSSFRNLVKYILAPDDDQKTLYTNSRGFEIPIGNVNELVNEMESTADLNKRIGDPVFHGILSFREGEVPTKEQIDEAVDIYLKELNLEGCQCFYGVHQNTGNYHIHLCVNRVDPVSHKAILPANGLWKKADERASRRIELAQGWEIEDSGIHYEVIDGDI
ncbi:MAG: relaxase/mobilization nuclease domain-containing protein [Cloacibacillus porcorum]|nr:relaxase/mobilization nuclease domain-containing protein [Cloacibacillus porcorum]